MQLPPDGPVQRKAADPAQRTAQDPPGGGAGGRAMPEPVRARMEDLFGTSFSAVRVHEGNQARQVGALAYTQGTDIHFAPGQYQPDSRSGQELLGHELAHVVQQSQGRVDSGARLGKGLSVNDDPALEREADEMGARVAAGSPAAAAPVRSPVQASAGAPVQMVAAGDASKIMIQLRKLKKGFPSLASLALPRDNKEGKAQLWQELVEIAAAKSANLSEMDAEAAATLYLEHKASEVQPQQGSASPAPAAPIELDEPFPLLDAHDQKIEPQSIDFTIPDLGRGRIALYQGVGEPSYKDTLTWMSHGIQASNDSKPSDSPRTFGFVVDANAKMIRPQSGERTTELVDSLQTPGLPESSTVPDMLVGAHNKTEFNADMLKAGGAALPSCHVAILCSFVPMSPSEIGSSYQTPDMAHLGHLYPPLVDIVHHVPQLGAYKKWLMLCCRSLMKNIKEGKDRPEQHPGNARPFDAGD